MKEIIEKTFLKETIEYPNKIIDLKEKIRLKKERGFYLDWISEKEFKVESKISVGTIMMNYNPGFFDGIKGYGKLTELNGNKTKIDLTTKVRIEMYFIGAIFIVFLLVEFFSEQEFPIWVFLSFPAMLIWFWIVYRVQEKILFKKVKKYFEIELKTQYNNV